MTQFPSIINSYTTVDPKVYGAPLNLSMLMISNPTTNWLSQKCSHPLIPILSPEIRKGIDTRNARYPAGRDGHVLR